MPAAPPGPAPGDRPGEEFSAGGVVVRGTDVVVIVPTRRGAGGIKVLALPKGHPEPGETPQQAALREVSEEAGVRGELRESLGTTAYVYERAGRSVAKRVEFFLIAYREGDPADHDHEVERACWMPLSQAATALTYPGERAIIARVLSRRAQDL
ncbi:MAG: NUDIX domain-containing protein [Actinomycetota bacterium]|nr:NUDIX domain-containing protein [Actinomycetota bacterium]